MNDNGNKSRVKPTQKEIEEVKARVKETKTRISRGQAPHPKPGEDTERS